jgi:hypothetical protein
MAGTKRGSGGSGRLATPCRLVTSPSPPRPSGMAPRPAFSGRPAWLLSYCDTYVTAGIPSSSPSSSSRQPRLTPYLTHSAPPRHRRPSKHSSSAPSPVPRRRHECAQFMECFSTLPGAVENFINEVPSFTYIRCVCASPVRVASSCRTFPRKSENVLPETWLHYNSQLAQQHKRPRVHESLNKRVRRVTESRLTHNVQGKLTATIRCNVVS